VGEAQVTNTLEAERSLESLCVEVDRIVRGRVIAADCAFASTAAVLRSLTGDQQDD
jgi:hypothetical protein